MYIKKINQPFSNPTSHGNSARVPIPDVDASDHSHLPAMSKKFLANFTDTSDEDEGTMKTDGEVEKYVVAASKDHHMNQIIEIENEDSRIQRSPRQKIGLKKLSLDKNKSRVN